MIGDVVASNENFLPHFPEFTGTTSFHFMRVLDLIAHRYTLNFLKLSGNDSLESRNITTPFSMVDMLVAVTVCYGCYTFWREQ